MIFEALQSELFRFELHSLEYEPEFFFQGLIIGLVSIHASHDLMTDLRTHAKHRQELESPRRLAFLSYVDAKK